jgi:hypothetical protein
VVKLRTKAISSKYLFSFKHPNFREEREWRLVHFASINPTFDRNSDLPSFRSYEGNMIPFLEVGFEESIKLILLAFNPDIDPDMRKSEIPLRWL